MAIKSVVKSVKKSLTTKASPTPKEPEDIVEDLEEAKEATEAVVESPEPKKTATAKPFKKPEFKATRNTKSMTWNQKVATARTDVEAAQKMGLSINSVLSSRISAAVAGVKSVAESSLTTARRWYKTPLLGLDYAFSKGKGIPAGAVIEFYGPEMGGKTTALLALAGVLQQRCEALVVIADTEASIDDSTMSRAHLLRDPDHLIVLEAPLGHVMTYSFIFNGFLKILEQYATLVDSLDEEAQNTAPPLVFVWDSLGGTSATDVELDDASGAAGSGRIGKEALELGTNMKKIKGLIRRHNIIFLVCNQQRAVINMQPGVKSYGDTEKPAGGHNWQHETDVRFRVRHRNPWGKSFAQGSTRIVNSKDEILGNIMYLENKKNKSSAPFRTCGLLNIFDMGIDVVQSNVLHAAFDLDDSCLIKATGKGSTGMYLWRDFRGTLPELIDMLRDDEDLQLQFEDDVRAVQLRSLDPNLPPPEEQDEEEYDSDDAESEEDDD